MDLAEKGRSGVNCIGLTQDRDKWRALVNSAINLQKNLRGLSPRTNYTDRRTALVGEVSVKFLWIEGATWSA
jgi:hypothetical protein